MTVTNVTSTKRYFDDWTAWDYSENYDDPQNTGDGQLEVMSGSCNHGMQHYIDVPAGQALTLTFDVDLGTSARMNIWVWDVNGSGALSNARAPGYVTADGSYSFTITAPTQSRILIQFRPNECTGVYNFYMDNVRLYYLGDVFTTVPLSTKSNYRFGYNGQEKDNELYGEGNLYTFEYRIHDPRLGRFLSVDPLQKSYAYYSPYQFAGNTPIACKDLEGLEPVSAYKKLRSLEGTGQGVINKTDHPVIYGACEGVAESINSYLGFIMYDWWKAETWTEAGKFIDEAIMASVPMNGYNPETPRVDALAQDFTDNVINGNSYTRSKYISRLIADFLIGLAGDKALSKLKLLAVSTTAVKGRWVVESITGWSSKAISYQEYVTGIKAGYALEVNGVKFDGIVDRTLLEAKSSYDNFIDKNGDFYSWFKGKETLIDQAKRQIIAADGAPIEWNFATQKTLDATQKLFKDAGIEGITFKYNPQQ